MTGLVAVVSTAFCLSGTMADGTPVRDGSVASNQYPLGTRLEIRPAPYRRRFWVVRDRIGWGTDLDFWVGSCSAARGWGRRVVRLRRYQRDVLRVRRVERPMGLGHARQFPDAPA